MKIVRWLPAFICSLLLINCRQYDADIFDSVKRNDIAGVERFIKKGVDVNKKDNEGRTPLMWAAFMDQKEIAHLLVKNKALINDKNKFGETALALAAMKGHADVAAILMENNADVNPVNVDNVTPL